MAESKPKSPDKNPELGTREEARPVGKADDGGEPRIREKIRDAKHPEEKPDPETIAQVEELIDE